MDRQFEKPNTERDPLDEAVFVNSPKEWDQLLGDQRTLGSTPIEESVSLHGSSKMLHDQVEDIIGSIDPYIEKRSICAWV